ncbi:heme-copper oxidase subunit III [Roseofilum sp. SID3]|uniref:cytochrome c oxidase subunit 3 n=1 Tax=unclassified Roseofilum TaxID=2620099 RepID=UPI000E8A3F54|nr:heme-copper oxidase subunit III [Roseofilum sp. Belize Diploria]MBP0014606.1 heme-copper oxidase subunit III [Roseofilum sp. SID3]MBP0026041.1 heme-copper oxidase subunit III [Roseofilum sp. SID2]MBP0033576.1 heme-copper oxidase subunit III [Roseofilum sp. Belize BBD 4]MBP0038302.1 heme-copper oxidase subunit III [Roseofilum sp. SID1]MBP0044265.1 heme-copper oxidase subunit III [Roseofilum sp. SBFL]HBQ98515.1 heme-copper oxidase subunit III [Cyanobacteria bacterium UBA11691]
MQSSAEATATVMGYAEETHGVSHHEEHPDHRIFGILMFLIAESMIFLGLFAAYLTFKLTSPDWQPEGTELELLLPGINTIILISSSFVIHKAGDAIKNKGDEKGLRLWFGITALMGIVFLIGQLYEYFHLSFGLTDNVFASTFYVLTGFHGLHVLFGLVLILGVLWRSRVSGHYSQESHFGVEAAEIYWHFVDVVWIVLFTLLYIL